MGMTADPLVYLTAALDAAEKAAEAAKGTGDGNWTLDETYGESSRIEDKSRRGRVIVYDEGAPDEDEAAHIVRHDPAAVLRRVAADRRILAGHVNAWGGCSTCTDRSNPDPRQWGIIVYPCDTVRLMAEGWGWTAETG
jgi:hypothetical protein